MTRLRVGLVGAGVAGQLAHAQSLWEDRDRFDFHALADASPTVRAAVGDRYGVAERHPDVSALLDLGLDAVVCAAPDQFHSDVVISALRAGLHVLCEKPLALTLRECDDIIAARDAAGSALVQVGYMKRFDPAYEQLLELLPDDPTGLRLISVEVSDPDAGPFTGHLPYVAAPDLPDTLRAEGRARLAEQVAEASGAAASPRATRALAGAYLSSMVHDVNLVHGVLERLGQPVPAPVSDAAIWDEGRGVAVGWRLAGDARAQAFHLNLPGVNDYAERLTVYCADRILELTFPSPYLRHAPTRLVERRSRGATGLDTTLYHRSYEEAFRNELRAFHDAIVDGAPVRTPPEQARLDVETLIAAYAVASADEGAQSR